MPDQDAPIPVESAVPPEQERRDRWRLIGPILRIAAEAGWLTVLYAAAAVLISPAPPALGPIEMAAFVAVGVIIAAFSRGSPQLGTLLLIWAVGLAGILGWLADPRARDLVLVNFGQALGFHLAGWLAALAVLRGATIDVGPLGVTQTEAMLRSSLPMVAVIWAVTTLLVRPILWLPFAIEAMWGTILLLGASTLSLGLSRLNMLHAEVTDPTTRRGWRSVVALLALAVIPIAAPVIVLSGIPVGMLLSPFAGPIQIVLDIVSIPLQLMVAFLVELLRPFAGGVGELIDRLGESFGRRLRQPPTTEDSLVGTVLGIGLIVLTALVFFMAVYTFARWLMLRRIVDVKPTDPLAPTVERSIVRPPHERKVAAPRRRRTGMPTDAVTAYAATLDELERHPELARLRNETPAGHLGRVRDGTMPGLADFSRLAAAYQVARYGGRSMTTYENQRAVGRFERLRRLLRSH